MNSLLCQLYYFSSNFVIKSFVSWWWCQPLSAVQLFVTPGTVACQALLFTEFSRQEYWSEKLFPSPGDLSNPGIEPRSPTLQVDSLPAEPQGKQAEEIKKRWQEYTEELYKKGLNDLDNHDGWVTHLEPDHQV